MTDLCVYNLPMPVVYLRQILNKSFDEGAIIRLAATALREDGDDPNAPIELSFAQMILDQFKNGQALPLMVDTTQEADEVISKAKAAGVNAVIEPYP